MLSYHINKIEALNSISSTDLTASVMVLGSIIKREIVDVIQQSIMIIDLFDTIGIENIPDQLKMQWLEEIEHVSKLKSFEVTA